MTNASLARSLLAAARAHGTDPREAEALRAHAYQLEYRHPRTFAHGYHKGN